MKKMQTYTYNGDAGFITYQMVKEHCHIDFIIIDNEEKGKGFGKKLLRSFVDAKIDEGVISFGLSAFVTGEAVFSLDELVNFYHSVGFAETSREIIKKDMYVNMSLTFKDK